MRTDESQFAAQITKRPDSFGYSGDFDLFGIAGFFGLEHRDSDALDRSNSAVIQRRFEAEFADSDQWGIETFSHWAVGYTVNLLVNVWTNEAKQEYTPEFLLLFDLVCQLANYPILDEEHHSELEYSETLNYVSSEIVRLLRDYDLSEDQISAIAHHLLMVCDDMRDYDPEESDAYQAMTEVIYFPLFDTI